MFAREPFAFAPAMKLALATITALLLAAPGATHAAEHPIQPGDSPQAILDRATPGDRLVFMPGLHEHALGKHRSLLYVDKPIEIELQEGATLSCAGVTNSKPRARSPPTRTPAKSSTISRSAGGSISHGPRWKGPRRMAP